MKSDYDIIGNNYFVDINESVIDEIIKLGPYSRELVYTSQNWSNHLKNYLILTHKPSLIKNVDATELGLLVNRYYWFKKFYYEYSRTQGIDAGIEQQLSLLIETMGNKFKDVDWDELQKIDQLIEDHA